MGGYNLQAQKDAQKNENERALRRLAYEAAMVEWKTLVEKGIITYENDLYSTRQFVELHLWNSALLHKTFDLKDEKSMEEFYDRLLERRKALRDAATTTKE